ncbi:MAG: hypothetical protein ABFC31_03005 [Clostridiaceae bacterium]
MEKSASAARTASFVFQRAVAQHTLVLENRGIEYRPKLDAGKHYFQASPSVSTFSVYDLRSIAHLHSASFLPKSKIRIRPANRALKAV